MGGGSSGMKAQSLQDQLKMQQGKNIKSGKYPPFTEAEVYNLQKKFKILDRNTKQSITHEEFQDLLEIKMHFFRERIYDLVELDMEQKKIKTMSFELFMQYLTVFHPQTDNDLKKEYMFQIYDYNQDGMITKDDLTEVFKLLFMGGRQKEKNGRPVIFQTNFMNQNYVVRLGKDIMNIVDLDKSDSIELNEFILILTDNDVMFRMNIVF